MYTPNHFKNNHYGNYFTTYDKDHDNEDGFNCAERYKAAFWYNECFVANPLAPIVDEQNIILNKDNVY